MSRIVGHTDLEKVDRLATQDVLDKRALHALAVFRDEVEMAIYSANREIIGQVIPQLNRDTFIRLAVTVAEARAHYIKLGVDATASASTKVPAPAAITALAQAREAYEELLHVFQAAERVIERGYVPVPRLTKTPG